MVLGFSLIGIVLLAVAVVALLAWPRPYRHGRAAFAAAAAPVQVLVLGDVGRSPRMQYHAFSLAQHGCHVQLVGYYESALLEELDRHPRLTKVALRPAPPWLVRRGLPFVVAGPLKVLWQVLDLAVVLAYATRPARWLLVQNPPSIPTLAVAALVTRLRGTRLLIDWHNYGWSILAGTRGAGHPFVAVSKAYEAILGRLAGDADLTVTAAMAAELRDPHGPYRIPLQRPLAVLHDRPAALFQPAPLPFPPAGRGRELAEILEDSSLASYVAQRGARLLVSSTSWTPDEDFQLLLDALVQYVREVPTGRSGSGVGPWRRPPILAVITGKGPQRALYERKLADLAESGALPADEVVVKTAFLPAMRDYARLLALADLGVCLHKSSSGVDLPMKVVDMFGAGLPVAAYSGYASFSELVREGENGRGFTTAGELAALLARLLDSSSGQDGTDKSQTAELARLREGARQESKLRWSAEWDRVVAPLLGLENGGEPAKEK